MAGELTTMPTSPLSVVIQHLRADLSPDGDGMTDRELLTHFVSSRDHDALAALVRRHAAMVWGVCRRLLNHQDAEDAFQATFLVLVRKATSVPEQAVANWLYGVARQTAIRLRATAAKRERRETQVVTMPEPTVPEVRDADLQVAVDEEVSRLPDHYRGVVILCDLEGLTRGEAARQLGLPEGSVASRLARARGMLAKRLTRRGVVFSGSSAAALLSAGSASASVPPALVASTIKAASLLAAGQAAGIVTAKVAALTDGVVKAMFVFKLKVALSTVFILSVVATGTTLLTYRMVAGQNDRKPTVANSVAPAAKQEERDLSKIEPPGGVPLPLVEPGTNKIGVDQLNKVVKRLESVPEKDLEQWVVELERIIDEKLKDGLPSPRQACRTDFAVHMSTAFDGLGWNPKAADKLYKRASTMPTKEASAWKAAFESLLQKKIGVEEAAKGEFTNLPGGPPWAVPLVLIPVDALHEGQKYSVERGKKHQARLKQLTKDDISLWKEKVDKFGGTELDAAVNIILLDEFFSKESFQRDKFKAAVAPIKPLAKEESPPVATKKEDKPLHFVEKPDMKPQFGWLPHKVEGEVTAEDIYVPSKAFIADLRLPGKNRFRELIDPRYLKQHGLTDRDLAYEISDDTGLLSYQVADDLRTILFVVTAKGGGRELIIVRWVVYEGRLYISPEKAPDPKTGIFKLWILRMKVN